MDIQEMSLQEIKELLAKQQKDYGQLCATLGEHHYLEHFHAHNAAKCQAAISEIADKQEKLLEREKELTNAKI